MNLDELFGGSSVPGLKIGRHELKLDRARIMAVLNITPDSFSDGGRFVGLDAALAQAERLIGEGADVLDVGGESTRPGAEPVSAEDEIARVVPVIEAIAARFDVPISVDTSKPEVMRAAVAAGAGLVNDVNALRADGALDAAAELKVSVCLMHMQGEPATMQQAPAYDEVVSEVGHFLDARVATLRASGVARERIVVDPGIGFGKTLRHNLLLLGALDELAAGGQPVLIGVSRKSMLGELTGRPAGQRLAGSLAAMLAAVARGAAIVRVHDVAESRDALRVWTAIDEAQ